MTVEQNVIETVRTLSLEQQQAVLAFSEFLAYKNELSADSSFAASEKSTKRDAEGTFSPQSQLGQKLYKMRQRASGEGMRLSSAGDIDREIAEHRKYRS